MTEEDSATGKPPGLQHGFELLPGAEFEVGIRSELSRKIAFAKQCELLSFKETRVAFFSVRWRIGGVRCCLGR